MRFSKIFTEVTPQIYKNDYQCKFLGILERSLACFFLLDDNQCLGESIVIKEQDSLWKRALHVISLSVSMHSVNFRRTFFTKFNFVEGGIIIIFLE